MKRSICLVLILILLVGTAPAAMAAGSAYMSGPSVVRAGDTIVVSFSAGGGIFGGSGSLSYDPVLLTLQGCSAVIGGSWVVEFSGNNFVFYDNSMASPVSDAVIFTATFTVNSALAAGTAVSVSANNVTLSDGQKDMSMGTVTYSAAIAPPLSDNCRLSALTVDNASITPAFLPDVLEYTASVPFEVSALSLLATAEHGGAKLYIENPGLHVAATTAVRITVTAENGAARTYVIYVTRAQDPNYVPSSNANLKELSVNGYMLSPVFAADVTRYYVWLPYEAESVTIKAVAEDAKAKATVGEQPELIPGSGTDIPVTVNAEDGTELVYIVTVIRAPKHEDVDRFLNGEMEPAEPETELTEPTKAPTEAPTMPPETQPRTQPAPEQTDGVVLTLPMLILAHLVCILVGAAVGVVAKDRANKKKE